MTFIADVIQDHPGAEKISYFLSRAGDTDTRNPNDTVLMRVVTDTAGVPLVSAPQAYGIAPHGLSFSWYNGDGVQLPNPVPQPEQIGQIFVSLTAAASDPIRGQYPTLTLYSTVYPRNLPLTPARSRPSAPGCQDLTYPDCESATMSWSTPTTNTDGTQLPLTDISYFGLYFGADPNNLSLYTKLARTINQWTITGLTGGGIYYIAVTCVSTSGVESYKCTRTANMSSGFTPEAPGGTAVTGWNGAGAKLDWNQVTQFTGGQTITTQVTYRVYRSSTSGFTPGPGNRLATVTNTEYIDSTMVACTTAYYQVTALACGNEGAPGSEVAASLPAPPSCPTGLTIQPSQPGQIVLQWTAPANRTDGSPLPSQDIQGYRIYADTVSSPTTLRLTVNGPVTTATVTGLAGCATYYANVQCVDNCGHQGSICQINQVSLYVPSACNPAVPNAPASVTATAVGTQITFQWPVDHADCDLGGYKLYYGTTHGGPYNGTGAQQGSSPIALTPQQVTQGNICSYVLTGLSQCQTYYAVVTTIDVCSPPHESSRSPEANGGTSCTPCTMAAGCQAWAVDGSSNTNVHLEIYTSNGGGETLTRLTPTYAGAAKVKEVWYGRPLAKIWASDGSAGGDGNVGPQPSGHELNVTDESVPSTTSNYYGQPLELVFDSDVRALALTVALRGYSGPCTSNATTAGASCFADFDAGNYNGWTVVSGTWAASSYVLKETATSSNYMLKQSTLTMGDLTYEAKMEVTGGTQHQAFLVFRYQSSSNYYQCGIRTDTGHVYVQKVVNGSVSSTVGDYSMSMSDNKWYDVRAVVTGTRCQVWINCQKVLDVNDSTMWSTGGVGLSTRKASASFDDVRIFAGAVLP